MNCGVGEDFWESLGTARRSNQSILKEISPGCSLERLMFKLKLQYFGQLMWRAAHLKRPWCWERLRAGGEGDDRGWGDWMASLTQWTWIWVNSGSWWWTGRPGILRFMGLRRVGHNWVTELSWTELNWSIKYELQRFPLIHWFELGSFKSLIQLLIFCLLTRNVFCFRDIFRMRNMLK